METDFIKMITEDKKTSAFIACIRLDLMNILESPISLTTAAKRLNVSEEMLSLFFMYLKFRGVLCESDQLFCFHTTALKSIEKIRNLRGIKKYIRNTEKQQYFAGVREEHLKMIVPWVLGNCSKFKVERCLEWGSSNGKVSEVAVKYLPGLETIVESDLPINNLHNWRDQKFDLIFLYNTIHYLSEENLTALLTAVRRTMKSQSTLCIADLFLNKRGYINYQYIPDWMAYGGHNQLFLSHLRLLLSSCGLRISKCIHLSEIGMDILLIKGGKYCSKR